MIETIDLESAEGTLWFSDEAEVTVDKIDFELEQASRLRGIYRKLTIFNGNYCYQEVKNRHERKYKYRVDLSYLDPRPTRERHIAWKWLYATLGLALLGALLIYSAWFANWIEPSVYFLACLVIDVSAMLVCLLLFMHNSYDRIIFKSQYGRIKFIELLNRYPDKKTFREFVGRFILQIKQAAKAKGYNQSTFLAQELVELRRLKDETVITQQQYEIAKTFILKHKGFQAAAA
ncbi:MAG: hypothetical protein ACERLB_07705 [Gammaproteobacteria bacterium]